MTCIYRGGLSGDRPRFKLAPRHANFYSFCKNFPTRHDR